MSKTPRFAEFFCGGGMVRAALTPRWECVLANDIDPMKARVYEENWGADNLILGDVRNLPEPVLQQPIDMFWASSPCQDFSLAGKGQGLNGHRSGVFHSWINKISPAVQNGFAPRIIAFENVSGLLARTNGLDFQEVLQSLVQLGYNVGALEIDARHYVPQSRPRLFVIGLHKSIPPSSLCQQDPSSIYHSKRLQGFVERTTDQIKQSWCWWKLDAPTASVPALEDMIEFDAGLDWFSQEQVNRLVAMMSAPSLRKLEDAKRSGSLEIGTLYKRGRPDEFGRTRQRAEVRFDGLAGCLRTPAGGSSRQTLLVVEDQKIKARLISSREAMRLMGLKDAYAIPPKYNDAYRVAGDGVVVPIVEHLDRALFSPALKIASRQSRAA